MSIGSQFNGRYADIIRAEAEACGVRPSVLVKAIVETALDRPKLDVSKDKLRQVETRGPGRIGSVQYRGKIVSVAWLAQNSVVNQHTIRNRLARGWSINDAISIPAGLKRAAGRAA